MFSQGCWRPHNKAPAALFRRFGKPHDAGVTDHHNLQRFLDAQAEDYEIALDELRAGAKRSHWMWYIFPQLAGLGHSPTAQYYALADVDEARAYLTHAILGQRLRQCLGAILEWSGKRTAEQILGSIDALKFRSGLTLFDVIEPLGPFAHGLAAFYGNEADQRTLALLNRAA